MSLLTPLYVRVFVWWWTRKGSDSELLGAIRPHIVFRSDAIERPNRIRHSLLNDLPDAITRSKKSTALWQVRVPEDRSSFSGGSATSEIL